MSKSPSAFLRSVLQNGVGRYVCQLQRLTLQFSKRGGSAKGLRDYIEEDIVNFAEKNPQVVLYVTPHTKYTHPKVVAEFLNGTKRSINVANSTREEILSEIELLRTQSGLDIVRMRKQWHTDYPSIQGYWHPFYNKDTSLNTEEFPSENPRYTVPKPKQMPDLTGELIAELEDIKTRGT